MRESSEGVSVGVLGVAVLGDAAMGRRRRRGWVLGVLGVAVLGVVGAGATAATRLGAWVRLRVGGAGVLRAGARECSYIGDGGTACAGCVFHVKHDVYRVAVDAGEWQCMLKAGRTEVDRLETRLVRSEPVINELAGVRRSRAGA